MPDSTPDARTRILDAAEHAFADGGLAGARVAAIADEAGVNKAMLYYYFNNKASLYNAVLERVFDQVLGIAEQVGADLDDPPATALMAFMDGYAQVIHEHPHVVRILLRSMLDGGGDALPFATPRLSKIVPLVLGQVVRGQADGSLNPALMPPLMAPALVAPIAFMALAAPLLSGATGLDASLIRSLWLQNTRELLLNGLVARPSEDS